MKDPRATALAKQMKAEGRTQAWLAKEAGLSPTHVSEVLSGRRTLTDQFHAACLVAFGKQPTKGDHYLGRHVVVPMSIYRRDPAVAEFVEESYEDAWIASWIAEHGAGVLQSAAARAFDRHHKIAAADRTWLTAKAGS